MYDRRARKGEGCGVAPICPSCVGGTSRNIYNPTLLLSMPCPLRQLATTIRAGYTKDRLRMSDTNLTKPNLC